MTWDWHFAASILPTLARGLLVTIEASLCGSALALVVGLFWALLRISRLPVLSQLVALIVDFLRGTPLLAQLYFLFYVLPAHGLTLSPFVTGLIGLGLHFSAYTSEVYRAGIGAVSEDQWQAIHALHLPRRWAWLRIVLPLSVRPILPALGNYVLVMFKESAVLSAITVDELLHQGRQTGDFTYRYLEPVTLVGLLYLSISYPFARLIRWWEARVHATH